MTQDATFAPSHPFLQTANVQIFDDDMLFSSSIITSGMYLTEATTKILGHHGVEDGVEAGVRVGHHVGHHLGYMHTAQHTRQYHRKQKRLSTLKQCCGSGWIPRIHMFLFFYH
jgi:hypothetical protein